MARSGIVRIKRRIALPGHGAGLGCLRDGDVIVVVQGREVLAVPSHPFNARVSECNLLIRNGITHVRSAGDIIESFPRSSGLSDKWTEAPLPSPPRT